MIGTCMVIKVPGEFVFITEGIFDALSA